MRFVQKGLLDPESLGGPSPSTAAGAPRPSASSGSRGRRIPVRPCAKAPEGSQGRRRLGMSSSRESRGTASLPRDSPASAAGVCISPSLRISANAGPRKSGSQLPGRLCVYWLPRKKKKKKSLGIFYQPQTWRKRKSLGISPASHLISSRYVTGGFLLVSLA